MRRFSFPARFRRLRGLRSGMRRSAACFLAALLLLSCLTLPVSAEEKPVIEHAKYAYVYNIENERELFALNPDTPIYPASTVKIMTAILAIENLGSDWDRKITVPEEAVKAASGSKISLRAGEVITVENLINSLIVGNANDSALTVAILVGGSVEHFVAMMNDRAAELGAVNTHFTNPTGIHDSRMATTLRDTAIIAMHAYRMTNFMNAAGLERYNIPATNKFKGTRYIVNKNYFVSNTVVYDYYNPLVSGMNAGNTAEAGNVVVAVAAKEGATQLIIVSGAESDENYNYAYIEAQKLMDWAFDTFDYMDILSASRVICEIPVSLSAKVDHVILLPEHGITQYMPSDFDPVRDVTADWTLDSPTLEAPVARGQVCGTLRLYFEGEKIGEVNLVTQNAVDRSEWLHIMSRVKSFASRTAVRVWAVILAAVLIGYVLFMAWYREYKRSRKKKNSSYLPRI